MEKILEAFKEINIDSYLIQKTFLKEFNEPYSTTIIAYYLKKMGIISLILGK